MQQENSVLTTQTTTDSVGEMYSTDVVPSCMAQFHQIVVNGHSVFKSVLFHVKTQHVVFGIDQQIGNHVLARPRHFFHRQDSIFLLFLRLEYAVAMIVQQKKTNVQKRWQVYPSKTCQPFQNVH